MRSNLTLLQSGDIVNVEPSLRLGDPLGGHIVYGHVDDTATIVREEREGNSFRLWCSRPKALAPMIVEKGYVALDGTSLTVASIAPDGASFSVALIPETRKRTTLGVKGVGGILNLEIDPIARYVHALMAEQTICR
jgi:riboflavin synthase alpha subunit